jgi:hypothetical protein
MMKYTSKTSSRLHLNESGSRSISKPMRTAATTCRAQRVSCAIARALRTYHAGGVTGLGEGGWEN